MLRRLPVLLLLLGLLGLSAAPSAIAGPVDDAPPANITVCRSSGAVEVVPFREYVKTVLSVEFFTDWPQETLRAGAVAIKSYAWYYVRHPVSERCHVGDTTRHQVYAPEKNRRTAVSDRAVDDTWHLRMWDLTRQDVAFAQYCSRGCRVHSRSPGAGHYMDQDQAFEMGQAGHTHLEMLHHFYRNLPMELTSWVDGLGLEADRDVISIDRPGTLEASVAGVVAGDERVQVAAFAVCTIDGDRQARLLTVVPTTRAPDGRTIATLRDLAGLSQCQELEASLHVQLIVNGFPALTEALPAWREWTSATARDVARVGQANEPVLGSVEVSRATFPAAPEEDPAFMELVGEDDEPVEGATHAVLARSDKFPDALGATALAGTDGSLLLHPPGPRDDANATVAAELERILAPGATVHVVGGPKAIAADVLDDLEERGFDVGRLAGSDRIATSIAVADAVLERTGGNGRVLLVRGFPDTTAGWADAVSVGPWAARTSTPVLLTHPLGIDPSVEAWIEDPANGILEVVVIGGPRAVGPAVVDALDGVTVTRVAGSRRDATALAVADELWGTRGSPAPAAVVAQNVWVEHGWPSAIVGSVPAARADAAAVSVWDYVPPSTTGLWLDSHPDLPVLVVGGEAAVSGSVEQALAGA